MRLIMLAQISGTRDGVSWPIPGEEIELPADEALGLVRGRLAIPALEPEEQATVPSPVEHAVIQRRRIHPSSRARKR